MSELHLQVMFWQVNREWHTRSVCRDIQMKIQSFPSVHCLAPNGRSLIFFSSTSNAKLCQHDFATPETFVIAEDLDATAGFGTEFSPLPPRWSGVYVSVLLDVSKPGSPTVVLVDAWRHEIVGSWTGRDLRIENVKGVCNWNSCTVVWSRNGRQVAIQQGKVDLILIF